MTHCVFLVDDHAVLRDGLRLIIDAEPDLQVVGEAADGRTAVSRIEQARPDIVLMDVAMDAGDGIEATARIAERCRDVRVIILSMLATRDVVYRALRAGAMGYLLKESVGREVIDAVRQVALGHRYLGQAVVDLVADDAAREAGVRSASSPLDRLSAREMQVLTSLVDGRTVKQIADALDISAKTVATYRARLMVKLETDNLAAVIKLAIRHGLAAVDS